MDNLRAIGIGAVCLHSGMTRGEHTLAMQKAEAGLIVSRESETVGEHPDHIGACEHLVAALVDGACVGHAFDQLRPRAAIGDALIVSSRKALADPCDYEARSNIMWTATWALNTLIAQGKPTDWMGRNR